jgi:beta-lactamase regulating signal transducer with metallopeptidase domain/predicted  nucleic acid-binding Zn-ribbon protein
LKALVLLGVAAGLSVVLRGRSARLRAVIWGTALVGSLLIPALSVVVPAMPIEVPVQLAGLSPETATRPEPVVEAARGRQWAPTTPDMTPRVTHSSAGAGLPLPSAESVLLVVWGAGALLFLLHHEAGVRRMFQIIRRGRTVRDPRWLELVDEVRHQVGCRQRVRLVISPELDIPAMFGVLRPVVLLPAHADTWIDERRMAVLQHELVHVVRLDWPVRVIARVTRAVYWFNPLAWWAVRRLDLEQEMACDEEVLSLGSRASSYACHLLGIARTAVFRPAVAIAGIEMARRSNLEERIMRILERSKHRKVGLAVILPAAVLTAALVPAIAAVQPAEPGPRTASPELKAAMEDMERAEEKIEPYIEKITRQELDLHPHIERIEAIEAEIDEEAIARIEAEMEPILAEIEALEIDMGPLHDQIDAMTDELHSMEFHIEDGTLEEVQFQIQEQMAEFHEQMGSIHLDLEPFHEQMEALHEQLEPMMEKIHAIHAESVPSHEEMERIHAEMEPFHEEMERIHQEMEPLEEELERMGERVEQAIQGDVADVLRSHLGPVTGPGAPYREAAARIVDDAHIHISNGLLELDASKREVQEILTDLFAPSRIGTQNAFDHAVQAAVEEVCDLEIRID